MRPPAPTVIIAVGDELLGGFTLDTNSNWLAGRFRGAGWPVHRIEVIGDQAEAIIGSIRRAAAEEHVSRILVCGGMGPTPDDRTVEAVAIALGRRLIMSDEVGRRITATVGRMYAAGWVDTPVVSAANLRMARVPEGSVILDNRRGMAPPLALLLADATRLLFVLPGIPREMQAIVDEEVLPRYCIGRTVATVVEIRYAGTPESLFSAAMTDVGERYPGVTIGSYPQTVTKDLIIRLEGGDASEVGRAAEHLRLVAPVPEAR